MSSGVRNVLTMSAMLIGGTIVGAGIALLMAPQSGRVTRGQIRVNVHRAQDEMSHVGGRVMQVMGDMMGKGQELIGVK
ncbi:MAG: YtxH domain-containing protein [Nitrospirota bacterium]|nr:YtxH domain-containing protein [Nitrospirota bacterium]